MIGVCPVEMLLTRHGHRTLAGLSRGLIITVILPPYADRPSAALSILKMLRILIRHAINIGWLKHHPSAGIKAAEDTSRSWTEDEIVSFRKQRSLGTNERTAFELFLNCGQCRADTVRMA